MERGPGPIVDVLNEMMTESIVLNVPQGLGSLFCGTNKFVVVAVVPTGEFDWIGGWIA